MGSDTRVAYLGHPVARTRFVLLCAVRETHLFVAARCENFCHGSLAVCGMNILLQLESFVPWTVCVGGLGQFVDQRPARGRAGGLDGVSTHMTHLVCFLSSPLFLSFYFLILTISDHTDTLSISEIFTIAAKYIRHG